MHFPANRMAFIMVLDKKASTFLLTKDVFFDGNVHIPRALSYIGMQGSKKCYRDDQPEYCDFGEVLQINSYKFKLGIPKGRKDFENYKFKRRKEDIC